jgi:hypothetical protein
MSHLDGEVALQTQCSKMEAGSRFRSEYEISVRSNDF